MPKKSRRHSTAPDAYWFTEQDARQRSVHELLWLRVLEQAWRDCHDIDNNDPYKARDAEYALVWIITNDMDFDAVCGLADVDPKEFRSMTIQSVKDRYPRRLLAQVIARHFKKRR
jgi:hypothetical protein